MNDTTSVALQGNLEQTSSLNSHNDSFNHMSPYSSLKRLLDKYLQLQIILKYAAFTS